SGLNQDIVEIPRSVTTLDSSLLKQLQVHNIHDLTTAAAGTYTSAYFGVAGAVMIRGNLADSYYRGFKGINNLGYYETPTESVSNIEIVRGPVSPMYGTGKLGGMINFTPKPEVAIHLKESDRPTALVTGQTGSDDLIKVTAEGGVPFKVGGNNAAIYGYAYFNKNGSYYRDFKPNDKEVQVGYAMDLGSDWQFNLGARYLDTKGHLAAPGWNRVTQQLIDSGVYLAGRPAVTLAPAGAQGLTPDILAPNINNLRRSANFITGVIQSPTTLTALDPATVHEVSLSRRNLNTSPLDYNNDKVTTAYGDLVRTFANDDTLKLQGFYEHLDNDMFSAAGSATYAKAHVFEGRVSYVLERKFTDWLSAQALVGASYRDYHVDDFQNYGRRLVIWDRNDISAPPTADMIINDPKLNASPNVWDFRYHSNIKDAGFFLNTDIAIFERLHLQGGVRNDRYKIRTMNDGLTSFGGALGSWYSASLNPTSYQISINYQTPIGLIPYYTYAKNRSIETNKGGGVDPALLINHSFLSPSEMYEVGLKGSLMHGRLYFAVDGYRMQRSQRDSLSTSITQARSHGVEIETRARVTEHFDLLGAATFQSTRISGAVTFLLTPAELGLNPVSAYGGEWTISTTQIPSLAHGYKDTTLPDTNLSLFGVYRFDWGLTLSGGGQYVSKTSGVAPGAIHLPAYATYRAGASYTWDRYTLDVAVNNLTDKTYFYLGQAAYTDVAVLPAPGRTWSLRLAAKF
ncbi:MAG: TonB-dependent receptor, partial [Phenylobacterium sp.]|nr:TonB-dependent receptor [Phenylobacterium sp.]